MGDGEWLEIGRDFAVENEADSPAILFDRYIAEPTCENTCVFDGATWVVPLEFKVVEKFQETLAKTNQIPAAQFTSIIPTFFRFRHLMEDKTWQLLNDFAGTLLKQRKFKILWRVLKQFVELNEVRIQKWNDHENGFIDIEPSAIDKFHARFGHCFSSAELKQIAVESMTRVVHDPTNLASLELSGELWLADLMQQNNTNKYTRVFEYVMYRTGGKFDLLYFMWAEQQGRYRLVEIVLESYR